MSPELEEFLTGLATDPDRMTRYVADPEAAMAADNLPEADREILRKTDPAQLGDLMPNLTMSAMVFPPPAQP